MVEESSEEDPDKDTEPGEASQACEKQWVWEKPGLLPPPLFSVMWGPWVYLCVNICTCGWGALGVAAEGPHHRAMVGLASIVQTGRVDGWERGGEKGEHKAERNLRHTSSALCSRTHNFLGSQERSTMFMPTFEGKYKVMFYSIKWNTVIKEWRKSVES